METNLNELTITREKFKKLNDKRNSAKTRKEKEIYQNKQILLLSKLTGIPLTESHLEGICKKWQRDYN